MEAQREPDTTSSAADDHGEMSQLSESRSSELDNSHVLSEVPVDDAPLGSLDSAEVKVQTSHNTLDRENTLGAQDRSQNQYLSPGLPSSSSESKALSVTPVAELRPVSAFNWRKYGQKLVKSPQGSRSYYRCTHADCGAKKIECSDQSNRIIEIIAKGQHNHDPPKRTNCGRGSKLASSANNNTMTHPLTSRNDKDSSTFIREIIPQMLALVETKGDSSSDSDSTGEIDVKEEHIDPPESQERTKKIRSPYLESLSNDSSPSKKAKVVQTAGDAGISGDGYRWRKYGQKMVKGSPHPRNYYRCTSGGCPARKLTEMAADNTRSMIVTYKGEHDHKMPLPKKKHSSPSNPLDNVASFATHALVENSQIEQTETTKNHVSTTQCSIDTGGELMSENLDLAEERAMESARTLLSIGFEIKQY